MKLKVYFYSTYGHNYLMAKAAAEGATDAGAEVELKRFPETIPAAVLKDMGADQAQKAFADVPELGPQDFADANTRQQAAIVLNCWNSMCGIANSGVNGNRPGKKITSAKNRWEV
jgi:multimeric flavodoxin WrbA